MRRPKSILALTAAVACAAAAPAAAHHVAQPPLDREVIKSTYKPHGFFKPGDPIPGPTTLPTPDANGIYNPSGHYSAYDTNVYESLNFPGRQADDESAQDPPGNGGDPRHGFCAPDPAHPEFQPYGKCPNHQLEWLDHWERTMRDMLEDFGGVVHRFGFLNESDPGPRPVCCGLSTASGKAYNSLAMVPGADHPEQVVVVGAHFDFTDTGPAAAWDSAEGHAEVMRMAAIMTEYWRRTGTRPSATVVFAPWDQEEAGSLGSENYLDTRFLEEEASQRIRGYFNVDPCAGAYPAFYHGNPLERVPMVMQVSDPSSHPNPELVEPFNEKAERIVDQFFAEIDDTVQVAGGVAMPTYTDADRGSIVTAVGGLLLFSSDYGNFDAAGVPIFNLFPDMFGPHADGTPASAEGASLIHTPRDNLTTLNALTSGDQSGLTASDGWMKGMELCAQLEARYMLEPEMGGAQTADLDPLAFFEVLPQPNGIPQGKLAEFDATGSYQYASLATRQYVADADLQFRWDFGDGSAPAYGKKVKHAYRRIGTQKVTLTVTNRETHVADTMSLNVEVVEGDGSDTDPAGQSSDPGLKPKGSLVACQSASQTGFTSLRVRPAGKGLSIDGTVSGGDGFLAEVFRVAKGRRALARSKRVARFQVRGSARWSGRGARSRGVYHVRLTARGTGSRPDVRGFAFARGARFKALKRFQRPDSCEAVSVFRLDSPVFGGRRRLGIAFTLTRDGRATVDVLRGRKRVKRFRRRATANRLQRVTLSPRRMRRGTYRIVLRAGGKRETLYAKRL